MLSIDWTSQDPATAALQTLVVVLASPDCATIVERLFGAPTAQAAVAGRFSGRTGEQFRFAREREGSLQTVVLLGLGTDAPTPSRWRSLAYEALRAGGTAPAILNAANEVAVAAFLQGRLRFWDIQACNRDTLDSLPVLPAGSLAEVLGADGAARRHAEGWVQART